MQIALIPPIANLEMARGRKYHLVLAHLVEQSQYYQDFYRRESENGSCVILDNSAHEMQHGQPIIKLLSLAPLVGASEIVIPDALFDWKETSLSAFHTFLTLLHRTFPLPLPGYSWMLVPQGKSLREWVSSLDTFSTLVGLMGFFDPHLLEKGITLGLSKDYEIFPGGLYSLIEDYCLPWAEEYHAQIHLLGWGRDLWALNRIACTFGEYIRSVDSAKPFVYGLNEIRLAFPDPYPAYPKRDPYYFDQTLRGPAWEVAEDNIKAFELAALDGRV